MMIFNKHPIIMCFLVVQVVLMLISCYLIEVHFQELQHENDTQQSIIHVKELQLEYDENQSIMHVKELQHEDDKQQSIINKLQHENDKLLHALDEIEQTIKKQQG